jgi:hypothetical protein
LGACTQVAVSEAEPSVLQVGTIATPTTTSTTTTSTTSTSTTTTSTTSTTTTTTSTTTTVPPVDPVAVTVALAISAQQAKLNELLTPFGYPAMPVDGDSGPITRRALCAFRLALGLPVNRRDLVFGSIEEQLLFATTALPMPPNVATDGRWIFIDRTCQILMTGEGVDRIVHVFPTSTGEEGFETRLQERRPVFRYNPAIDNGGWHNSSIYPVADDNPLNGNMYKPLYFDRGQAIHGAGNVPPSPQSKGCARLRPANQDALVAWLGLADVTGQVGRDRIDVTVTVRGDYALG